MNPELWAETATKAADDKHLQIVVLGGANDDHGPAREIAQALWNGGVRFAHANGMHCLPKAVYIIATMDESFRGYSFASGSMVVDPFGMVTPQPGVAIANFTKAEDDQLELDI